LGLWGYSKAHEHNLQQELKFCAQADDNIKEEEKKGEGKDYAI
jgi:hypothetical protein